MNAKGGNSCIMPIDKPDAIKVIVSHDVDHLFSKDHWFRDLIYPKMWVRNTIQLIKKDIIYKEWWLRNTSCFRKTIHNLEALMDYDEAHGVPSTFFFGMNQGLGMSYKPEEAKPVIRRVHERGFDIGVHGIEYQDYEGMKREFNIFKEIAGFVPCGIRMHYVRYDGQTFDKLNQIGYSFDTSEFDKSNSGTRKTPYQVGNMWEFPLAIMDGYLPQKFEKAKIKTLEILDECKEKSLQYITILFHDNQFCDDYHDIRKWYIWLTDYLSESEEFNFISYRDAIFELQNGSVTV